MDASVKAKDATESESSRNPDLSHGAAQLEGGFGGAPAVAFARVRKPEDSEHAVALDASHGAAEPTHRRLVSVAQRGQQVLVVLRLHGRTDGRRVAKIAADQAQVAALPGPGRHQRRRRPFR